VARRGFKGLPLTKAFQCKVTDMTKANNVTGWYGSFFKNWAVKLMGAQPTADQLATIHYLGARPGKQALANAMALRDGGVTGSQIVMACGAPQLNKMRGFVADGLAKFEAVPAADNGHKVYKLNLTPKGLAKVAKAKAAAEAAAAHGDAAPKAPSKPRKGRKAPAATQAPVDQPQATGAAPEAIAAPVVTDQPQAQA